MKFQKEKNKKNTRPHWQFAFKCQSAPHKYAPQWEILTGTWTYKDIYIYKDIVFRSAGGAAFSGNGNGGGFIKSAA